MCGIGEVLSPLITVPWIHSVNWREKDVSDVAVGFSTQRANFSQTLLFGSKFFVYREENFFSYEEKFG
jgi:hypothetical protein